MSHLKLTVLVKTDGDDFATRREQDGAHALMAHALGQVRDRVGWGRNDFAIYDTNGNTAGHFYLSEAIDS